MTIYAEVIGDPIGHSLSPVIHRHWLAALGLDGDYRATRVERGGLAAFLDDRRADRGWRGCNVTLPHKEPIARLLTYLDDSSAQIGAVNCVYRRGDDLSGTNTDIDGIAHALAGIELSGAKAVVIGAGGAARAALAWLAGTGATDTVLLVRDAQRAEPLLSSAVRAQPIDNAPGEIEGAQLIINASPLGMAGSPPMPQPILDALSTMSDATVMDMVYKPLETELLAAARNAGLRAVDGLEMLTGQARRAFQLFFGVEPPPADAALRALLTSPR